MAASASCISLVVLVALATAASAQLSPTFYSVSCPGALAAIKSAVTAAVSSDPRMGASLLRLHFHDCFVQGCDASVLLSGNEQNAGPNAGSLRGFGVIDGIKAQVEAVCKQTVSCADILAVAARDSVVAVRSSSYEDLHGSLDARLLFLYTIIYNRLFAFCHVQLGGPSWTVPLGRRDSTGANAGLANSDLPGPGSSRAQLEAAFLKKGLDTVDMVALSGAHTIGQAQCSSFRSRIYGGDTNINAAYAASLRANCPQSGGNGNLAPLDTTTPNVFDNAYYTDLLSQKGLMHSDQVLFNGDTTDNTVRNFASNPAAFSNAFTTAMIKMGNIAPLTGAQGQIRLSCSKVNS
uniref:Peroxidase n=1 Tax=Aegilops tauschii subsp. strangulata TaxID=200361 RepID=A0A453APK1_AEGTS